MEPEVKLLILDCDGVLNDATSDISKLYVLNDKQLKLLSHILKDSHRHGDMMIIVARSLILLLQIIISENAKSS